MLQGRVDFAVAVIMQHGVAMAEGAPTHVLAGEADALAGGGNARQGEGFAGGPVQ